MTQHLLSTLLIFFAALPAAQAQEFRLQGKITNRRLEPLPYASINIKQVQQGAITDLSGNFTFQLEAGRYDILVSLVGYKKQLVTVTVTRNDTLYLILEEDAAMLGEVQVVGARKDHAEEIVRNVIRQKERLLDAAANYSCNVYIKASDDLQVKPGKNKQTLDTAKRLQQEMNRMNLAEVYLKVDQAEQGKLREERTAVSIRGSGAGLFFLTTTDGDFNFYRNLVHLPALAPTPMLSPICNSGLIAYKYKTKNIRKEKGRTIYTITVTPTRLGNALVTGEMEIMDSAWVLLSSHFELPKFHLTEYDFFAVDQQFAWVDNKAWVPVKQEFSYHTKAGKTAQSGRTIAVYSDYTIDTNFARRHFTTEVSATTQQAYERDSSFWETVRKEPLTGRELAFIQYKDSVKRAHTSAHYLDSVDAYNNKVTLKKVLLTGVDHHDWRKERFMMFGTLPELYKPLQFGGARIGYRYYLFKTYKSRKNLMLNARASYGFRNRDVQGAISFAKMYNPFNRGGYFINVGREFGMIFAGDAWINQLKRSNIYLREGLEVGHSLELANGLVLLNKLELTGRKSVAGYKTNARLDSSFIGRELTDNQAIYFEPYNAFYNTITLEYTPQQRYIREPKEKVILGSKWPTFGVTWRKGVPGLFKSRINFDYLEFGVRQKLSLGLLGESRYTFISGAFLSRRDLRLVDYKFMRRGDPLLFSNPTMSFQSLDSTFPAFRRFYEGHFLHQFHGAVLNKIPLLKQLKLQEVAGGGILYLPERNLRYAEVFVGVEKVIRFWRDRYKVGTYIVGSVANKYSNPIQFKIGIEMFNKQKNSWY